MNRKAVFLDRDGTIIEEANYLADPDGVRLLDDAAKGIRVLKEAGFQIIVTSNQSGVARGYFTEEDVNKVNERMIAHLMEEGALIDSVYYCPHHKKGIIEKYTQDCDCRKPKSGMIEKAADEFGIDLYQSWVIGDKSADIEFGQGSDCRTVLVLTGYGKETRDEGFLPGKEPTLIVKNLNAAALAIVGSGSRS